MRPDIQGIPRRFPPGVQQNLFRRRGDPKMMVLPGHRPQTYTVPASTLHEMLRNKGRTVLQYNRSGDMNEILP